MRPALTSLLYERYPGFYWNAKLPMPSCGIRCDDGWFSILDAHAETVIALDPESEASQVEERGGSLSFKRPYHGYAVRAAEYLSTLVCEVTGYAGDLMSTGTGGYKTLSPEAAVEINANADQQRLHGYRPIEYKKFHFFSDPHKTLPLAHIRQGWDKSEAIAILRERAGSVLTAECTIDIPAAGFALAYAIISSIIPERFRNRHICESEPRIRSLTWTGINGLIVEFDESSIDVVGQTNFDIGSFFVHKGKSTLSLEQEIKAVKSRILSACLFASNMSKRIDLETGRMGPVDDQGRLIE